jgi:hypothetical protein
MMNDAELKPVMQYWMWAMLSGYYKPEEWIAWADDVIARSDSPPYWVIEMASHADPLECSGYLQAIADESGLNLDTFDPYELYLGYRYAALRDNKMDMPTFFDERITNGDDFDAAISDSFPEIHNDYLSQDGDVTLDQLMIQKCIDKSALLAGLANGVFGAWAEEAMSVHEYLVNRSAEDVLAGRCVPDH